MNPLRNERGFSLVLLALIILLSMTAIGIAMLQTSQRELKSVNKLKLSTQAFYSAESGITIAKAELNNITDDGLEDPAYTHPQAWMDELLIQLRGMRSEYTPSQTEFEFDQDSYNLTGMTFDAKVSFIGTGNNITCYGMKGAAFEFEIGTLQEFYDNDKVAGEDFWPVFIITAIGREGHKSGGLFKYAERNVQIRVQAEPSFSFPEAALTLNGTLDQDGQPNSIVGEGRGDTGCDAPDIAGLPLGPEENPDENLEYDGNTGWNPTTNSACDPTDCPEPPAVCECEGSPEITLMSEAYPVSEVISVLVQMGEEIVIPVNGKVTGLGDADNTDGIYYYQGTIDTQDLDGYGILVVTGDLLVSGHAEWRGLIIVGRDVNLSGNAGNDEYIEGSIIAGGDVRVGGNPDVYFDCNDMLDLWKSSTSFRQMWWQEIKGRMNP